MIKYCIFDLDGTLLDTLDTITYYVNETLTAHGISPVVREECSRFVGRGAKNLIKSALEYRGVTDTEIHEALLSEYLGKYNSNPYHLTRPYEGIEELISSLNKAGLTLAVLSNKQQSATQDAVAHFFPDGGFVRVYGGRDGIPLKPSADAVLPILEELGAQPCECAYIGDSEVDVKTALNFGAALPIAVLWGFRTRDELLDAGASRFVSTPVEIISEIEIFSK